MGSNFYRPAKYFANHAEENIKHKILRQRFKKKQKTLSRLKKIENLFNPVRQNQVSHMIHKQLVLKTRKFLEWLTRQMPYNN